MFSTPRLDAGLLVGGQDEVVVVKLLLVPNSFVKVENPAGFFSKLGIAGKNPATVVPGSNGIFVERSP